MSTVCTLTVSMSLAKSQCVIMVFSRMHKNKLKKKKKTSPVVSHTQVFVRRTLCNVHSREHTPIVLSPGWFWQRNTKPNDKSYQQRKLSLGSKVIDIGGILPRFPGRGSACWKRRNEPPCSIAGCKTLSHQQHARRRGIDLYAGAPFSRPASQKLKFTPCFDLPSTGLKWGERRTDADESFPVPLSPSSHFSEEKDQ